tara:strand:- start:2174 stop:4129 length:1956 start_codon:yes stop_codon:yes gene_type:complete
MKWNFDIGSQNLNETGESTFGAVLEESAAQFSTNGSSNGLVSMFTRETISNSADQKIQGSSSPTKIIIDLISIDGEAKKEFKKSIDWSTISQHIVAAGKNKTTTTEKRLADGFLNFEDDNKETLLIKVSDFNANGLVGGETGSEEDANQNFHLFCRAVFKSQTTVGRQGSFGLGKGVLYHCSNISTVIMSSLIKEGSENKTRVYGRSELPSHECNDGSTFNSSNRWAGAGFFGNEIPAHGNSVRVISSFDESSSELKKLFLDRDESLGTGTSALCIGFDANHGSKETLIAHFKSEIRRSFWPALCLDNPEIEVSIRTIKNYEMPKEEIVTLNEQYEPFVKCFLNSEDSTDLGQDGNIVSQEKEWTIPSKIERDSKGEKSIIENEFQGLGLIKVHRSNFQNKYLKNKIALIRRNLSVVSYEVIKTYGDSESCFYGVFKGGESRGDSKTDKQFSNFLRDAEPPLHNHWKYKNKIETNYDKDKVPSFLSGITNDIKEIASTIADSTHESNKNDYAHLAKHFNFGSAGDGEGKKYLSFKTYDKSDITGDSFTIKVKVNNLKDNRKKWSIKTIFSLEKQRRLPAYNFKLKNLNILNLSDNDLVQRKSEGNSVFLTIDKSIYEVDFEVEVCIPDAVRNSNLLDQDELVYTINVISQR